MTDSTNAQAVSREWNDEEEAEDVRIEFAMSLADMEPEPAAATVSRLWALYRGPARNLIDALLHPGDREALIHVLTHLADVFGAVVDDPPLKTNDFAQNPSLVGLSSDGWRAIGRSFNALWYNSTLIDLVLAPTTRADVRDALLEICRLCNLPWHVSGLSDHPVTTVVQAVGIIDDGERRAFLDHCCNDLRAAQRKSADIGSTEDAAVCAELVGVMQRLRDGLSSSTAFPDDDDGEADDTEDD
jgi:hypothetical protein